MQTLKMVELGPKYPNFWIQSNPVGNGFIICVTRGISCEFHTKVVSCHDTTVGLEDIKRVLPEIQPYIDKELEIFIALCNLMGQNWNDKGGIILTNTRVGEFIGTIYLESLLQRIIDATTNMMFIEGSNENLDAL